ncbi:multiple epidermal growth factor-like domains protein 10 [Saccostrea echinata]|uniref:multiple epidermal growth factor-like domains protein 10 n=1 Tax=Saccostrea echinata TaxID=191078 RepID=UPI002A7F7625|nr:multiple epidermal growth factor-like domains protein 10 [Saccostrea echinata]
MDVDTWIYLTSLIFLWVMIISFANCYEQLIDTRKTKVKSSSTYKTLVSRGSADYAIDGNYNQHYTNCLHTDLRRSEAWLTIDLGDIYNLKSVEIWYRDDSGSARAYRLKGFSILASKNPGFDENDTCYQDQGIVAPETVLEVNCFRTARFIKIHTNKIHDEYGAILEICELQIFGCPRWKYGEKCMPCGNCKMDCHVTGQCDRFGCVRDGYLPPYCKECKSGSYGKDCNSVCGHCANNATCNEVTGSCPDENCEAGWTHTNGRKCDKECQQGFYGRNCSLPCGHCENKAACNHVTGTCPSSFCESGWIYSPDGRCNQACKGGSYGKNCLSACGHCANNATCNLVNGSCPEGNCAPGWIRRRDRKCNQACNDGWYGRECKERCGYCRGNKPCHHVTGSCLGLCEPGYHGDKCEESEFSQLLVIQRKILNSVREFLAFKKGKAELKANGTSPTDLK